MELYLHSSIHSLMALHLIEQEIHLYLSFQGNLCLLKVINDFLLYLSACKSVKVLLL